MGYHCFREKEAIQMDDRFLTDMKIVERAIREAGFIPYDQLYGYVQTGNSLYITRKHNARQIVEQMDSGMIRRYLNLRKSALLKNEMK
jgi:uncharacterized protein (UPF0297 family)